MVLAHNIEDGGRTQDVQISQGVTFDSMLLTPDTLRGLHNCGFYKPSPIQLHGIPLGKCGFDLLLEAKSGTGKTAVFSIVVLEQIDLTKGLQAVILAPTREIAAQICDVTKQIASHYKGLRVEVVMGGLPVHEDITKFKDDDVHIVVGSPGRLRHLIQDKHIDISAVRLLILDEADKLLEKSFLPDINYIFSILPKQKQVIMSSATYPAAIKKHIKQYLQSAQHICPDSSSILLGITQKFTVVQHNSNIVKQTTNRFEELLKILSKFAFKQCLIFCNYQARVVELHKMLKKHEWPAEQLYGQQEQLERLDALKSLQEYKCRILISTDLTARGIDASNVDLVINFEPPFEWQTYLHRIGRAGRFGSYGTAITILSKGREEQSFGEILKTIKVPISISNGEEGQVKLDDGVETSTTSQLTEPSIESMDVKTAGKCQKLWDVLTSDIKEISDDLENFAILCSSYNTVREQVESFSDLSNSLENHQSINGTRNLYQHLKMQAVSIPDKNILPTTNESKLSKRTNCVSDIQVGNKNNSGNNSDTKEKLNKKYISNSSNFRNCDRNKNEFEESKYEYDDTTQALLNAGLPTAFGRPKISEKKTKLNYSRNGRVPNYQYDDILYSEKTKEANKNRLSYKDTEDSDTSQGFYNIRKEKVYIKTKGGNKHVRKPVRKSGYVVDDENYKNIYHANSHYSVPTYSGLHRNRNASEIESETDHHNTYCVTSEEESYSSTNSSYINWYNTLKSRTKQVEYAIYIEEMSKFYYQ